MKQYFFLSIACGLLALPLFAQAPVTVESLGQLPQVSDPIFHPSGKYVLFTLSLEDPTGNRRQRQLIFMDLDTRLRSTLTYNVEDPQLSPDGRYLSYFALFGDRYGLYRAELKINGNQAELGSPLLLAEARQSNHFLGHPTRTDHAWSPDGRYIAYIAADPATCRERTDANEPLVIDRTLYKTRTAFSDNCLSRIFLVSADGQESKVLTTGPYDCHSLSWAPDSRQLSYLSNQSGNADHNYNNDLWKVDVQSGSVTRLTNTAGTEHDPQWSPRGDWIAYPATVRPVNTKDSPPENTDLYAISPQGGAPINLTAGLDRRASAPQWGASGEWLYFSIRDQGKTCIYRVRPGEPASPVICEKAMAGAFDLGAEKMLFTYSQPGAPAEIYLANLDGTIKRPITFMSRKWKEGKSFAELQEFWFDSFDGARVQGFVAYPAQRGAGKLPVIHRIHGGPHGMYGYSFSDLNELLVGRGYAVVFINPRGSTGYGQQFADGTYQAWGGGDYQDLMLGLDAALQQFAFLDGEKLGVIGGSYGGFMTNWVVTQTDRYKAAVSIASVSNLISFYGTSLYQLLIETEFGGLPWDNYELLWQYSPLAHVKNVSTPTLLLHGENDHDVPITQAEEFYIALRKRGVPTRLVRYPNEGHGIRQPRHRRHYFEQILNWFDTYLPVKGE